MSRSKSKGTAAETAVVNVLKDAGFDHVERRALSGALDRGDIAGIVGVVIEVKNHAKIDLAQFVDEAEIEANNDGADLGVTWIKRRGKSSPLDWYVVMTGRRFVWLLRTHFGGRR